MRRGFLFLVFSAVAAAQGGRGASAQAPGRGAPTAPVPATIPAPKDLKYPPLRPVQLPPITTATLSNGLRISLLEDHELPLISGIALVRAGSLLDPPEKIGLASVVGTLLRTGGTAAKTAEQVDNVLETMAASIESVAEDSSTRVTFATVKENAETVLGLFKEVLTQPEFRQDKVDLARSQMRTAIAQRNDDLAAVVHREFFGVVYGKDSPFGWVSQYATVDRIARNDVRAFHRRYFFPANVTLAICGDFDPPKMKALLEKLFAGWDNVQPAPEFPKAKGTAAPGIHLAERKDLNQTYFSIGHLAARTDDKDIAPLQIMTAVLANGSRGRLTERVRAKTGATDEIRAAWLTGFDRTGLFEITGNTRSIGTVDVIQVILSEIERMRTTEITAEELDRAREALLNSIVFSFETRARLMARQLAYEFSGYPKDYLPQYQKALQAVTRGDVQRVAHQYIVPANLAVVAVANPQMLGEPMEKLAAGSVVNAIDLTIPAARAEAAQTTDTSLAEGKLLLQRAQKAAGGVEKLAAIKDCTTISQYQIDPAIPNVGGSRIVETDLWMAPTTFRQDSTLPSGRVAAYTDGRVGWIVNPRGWGALVGTQQKQVFGDLFRSWFRILLSDRIEGRSVNAVDTHAVQITDTTGQEAKIEFDPATGLPRRVTYDTPQAVGAPLYTEDVFEEFRDVDGIKLPSRITINQSGKKFAEVTVSEYKLNSGLKASELARRPL